MELLLENRKLFYTDQGNPKGLPLVFIHGFPFSHAAWDPQVEVFQKDFRIITYDLRGHGGSDAGDGQFPLEFLVDDFFKLLDSLKIERAIVCGLSIGGYIALRAIERNPERFQALILSDTRSEADSNEAKLKRAKDIQRVKKEGLADFTEDFLKVVFTPAGINEKKPEVDKIRQVILKNPPLGVCGTLLALATRTDTTASLAKIAIPTLILVGEQDPATPPAASQSMKEKIAGAKLFIIPAASHLSNLENPAVFNKHLADFLSTLKAS